MRIINLPEGWESSTLSNAISTSGLISDGDWVESKDQDPNGSVRLIQLADIGDGDFKDKSERFMTPESASALKCTFLKSGDVLIARMPDPLGRACLFPEIGQDAVTVVDVCLIRTGTMSAISNKILAYWINSPSIRDLISANASGTTRQRITRKKLELFDIPIPPQTEQNIIADKLDSLLVQVETTKARLDRIPQILKTFRQSVLSAAISGKLTDKWRANKQYAITAKSVGELAKFVDYRGRTPKKTTSGIPLITAKNIKKGYISREPREFIADGDYDSWMTRGIPNYGDVLITTEAPMGNVANINIEEKFALAQRAICLQFNDVVNPYFASIYMQASEFQKALNENATGSTVKGIKAGLLKKIKIEFPPLGEQSEIVNCVEELFAFSDRIELQTNAALKHVNNLTESILAEAFCGELTADWRAANPELISGKNRAEALLARIKSEREEIGKQSEFKRFTVKKKTGKSMSKQIIKVVEALKEAGKPLSGQQLLSAAGYPSDSNTDQLEKFFLDIRDALKVKKPIIKVKRGDDGQDWFTLIRSGSDE